MNNSGYIDLHVHSNVSDGKFTVEQIMENAANIGVTTISFTEHYNMGSYYQARKLSNGNIEVIPGVEIGTSLEEFGLSKKHICHILAYYPSYSLCEILDHYEMTRQACVKKTLKKLQQNIILSYSDVVKYARDKQSIGRFDIAIALYKKGYAKSPVAAYGEFLELGTAGYISREKMGVCELIERIRKVNGVPVIAHPKSLKLSFDDTFNLLKKLKEVGLEGIEVYNPNNNDEQRYNFLMLSKYFDLLPTCGSDFHGLKDRPTLLATGINNNLCITDYSIIDELKDRHHKIYLENKQR
ncbi:MAG: PHP domain-containing protein [Clostridia bacterium]|nr:PHP domain-containing protein [Clostridia bacterium]